MAPLIRLRHLIGLLPLAAMMLSTQRSAAQTFHPINHLARAFNKDLVKLEDRVNWLERRLTSLATYGNEEFQTGMGIRAGRVKADDPDPSVVMDLGKEYPLDSLYLVPAQRESGNGPSLFPRKFTIELSNRADFGQRMILFTSGAETYKELNSRMIRFAARGASARYIRLTVHQGHEQGGSDIFALSEFIAISGADPVSFGAQVTGEGILDIPGIWEPQYLTDGRTSLGIWQSCHPTPRNGDAVAVTPQDPVVSWELKLEETAPLDRIVLFPHLFSQMVDTLILPDAITVEVQKDDGPPAVIQWSNPLPGSSQHTPLIIPLHRIEGNSVKITALTPWRMGEISIQGLSEIQVRSQGKNLSADKVVKRSHAGKETNITTLTDGFSADRQALAVATWLNQLHERQQLENELQGLRPIYHASAAESELNATWGSAIMLGLTFLIPVFIVERRRLINRNHLEKLRKRIASDLHDDIGSNLGSISLIARSARKGLIRMEGSEEVAEDLGELEIIARESSLAMRDIVWLLEQRADSIGDLVQRMRDTANRLLRNVEYTIDCDSCKTATRLSLDAKRHLFLFYKETIHNIFKHSKATRVSLRMWDQEDNLLMEVCDNGVGFDTSSNKLSSPVHKLEERARALSGQLDILSIPTKGTSIRLTVKRSLLIATSSTS
jgi:signal transduction histidine kinase